MRAKVTEYRPGHWRVRWWWKGQEYSTTKSTDGYKIFSLEHGHRLCETINADMDRHGKWGHIFDPRRYTSAQPYAFSKACDLWLQGLTCSGDTRRHYGWDAERWLKPYWQEFDIRELTGIHLKAFLQHLQGVGGGVQAETHPMSPTDTRRGRKGESGVVSDHRLVTEYKVGASPTRPLSAKTIHNIMGELHAMLNYHSDSLQRMPKFPTVTIQAPSIHPLTSEQQDKIFAYMGSADLPIFVFLRWTGCRPSEACALQRDCINWQTGEITIKRAMGERSGDLKPCTKSHRERTVYIIPEIEWALKGPTIPYVFMRFDIYKKQMIPYNTDMLQYHWARATKAAGIQAKLYEGTRHSFATQRIGMGVDKVQKVLGHTNIRTTQRYVDYKDTLKDVQRGVVEPIRKEKQNG